MTQKWQDLGWLALRVTFGLGMAVFHGFPKLFGGKMEGVIATVRDVVGLPFPTFFGWLAGLTEFVGGILLAIGLATRPAAFMLAGTMVVALYRHRADPFARMELAILYLVVMAVFVVVGGGRYALERRLGSRRARHTLV